MPWDAVRYYDYGYSHMTIINSTHILWQQISDEKVSECMFYSHPLTLLTYIAIIQDGKVIDHIYIVRPKNRPS